MAVENSSVLKRLFRDTSPLSTKGGEELGFSCPFCKHHKKKLNVNINTGAWHCWVCGEGGKSFKSLLKKVKASYEFYSLLKVDLHSNIIKSNQNNELTLPREMKPLYIEDKRNPVYKRAYLYCKKRGLTYEDLIRYKIGYCEEGEYSNRIIIPSYDSNNKLNFFCGRDFYESAFLKYKLCKSSKNIIGFESYTDFRFDITLVEGVFDAFGVRYNVIPLFGKFLSDKLKQKLISNKPPQVNVLLDNDAYSNSLKICEFLIENSIKCNLVILTGKDPNEIGFEKTWECINKYNIISESDIFKLKLENKLFA